MNKTTPLIRLKSMLKTGSFLGVCLLSVCLTLSACGTKGPLYIPEQRYPQKVTPQKEPVQKEPVQKPNLQDEGKTTAPEANTGAPSSPAQ